MSTVVLIFLHQLLHNKTKILTHNIIQQQKQRKYSSIKYSDNFISSVTVTYIPHHQDTGGE